MFSRLALVLFTLTALLASPIVRAQELPPVVAALPDSFGAAIIVPNMGELSDEIASFEASSELGVGELQDSLGMFQRELGLIAGVKRDGAMMVVLTKASADSQPSGVMLVQASDYAALVGALDGDPSQTTSTVTLPGGTTGFCRQVDQYAVLGGDEQAVNAVAMGQGLESLNKVAGQNGLLSIAESQFSVVVNTSSSDAQALASQLTAISAGIMAQLDLLLAADLDPEPWMPMLASLNQAIATGTTGMAFGLSFSEAGLRYTEAYLLKDGTEFAEAYKAPAQTDSQALLGRLPNDTILFAAAGDPQAVSMASLIDQLGGVIGLDPEHALGDVKPELEQLLKSSTGCATAVYAVPAGKVQSHWLNSVTVLQSSDAAAQRAAVEKFIIALNGAELPTESGEPIKLIAMYRKNDQEIGGASIDTFTIRAQIPESMKTSALTEVIALLAGGGVTGHVVSLDDLVAITTVDDSEVTVRVLVQLQRGNGLGQSGQLADLKQEHLPDDLTVLAYLDFNGISESLNPLLQLLGNAKTLEVPAGLPPVAMGMTNDAKSLRAVTFIPAETVKMLVNESFELSSDEPQNP